MTRPARVLRNLPVGLIGLIGMIGRIHGGRVTRLPKPPRIHDPEGGRPSEHGPEFRYAQPETWPDPAATSRTAATSDGETVAPAWDQVHPRLTHRAAWLDREGELHLHEGTLTRPEDEHLPRGREAPAVWLWSARSRDKFSGSS
ncbi:hypothetical protein [Streptomyces sp. NPDC090994]|uniref:hypothetical protein n=1 Tax=Streptomyces sp. NPDC090994 TaxID=3365969 RepID=UPI003826904D